MVPVTFFSGFAVLFVSYGKGSGCFSHIFFVAIRAGEAVDAFLLHFVGPRLILSTEDVGEFLGIQSLSLIVLQSCILSLLLTSPLSSIWPPLALSLFLPFITLSLFLLLTHQ